MKKAFAISGILLVGGLSVALAGSAPKPMACDAWACKGASCAPAKYAVVRNVPALLPLFGSQLYGAAAIEGSLGLAGFLAGVVFVRSRRASKRKTSLPAIDPTEQA